MGKILVFLLCLIISVLFVGCGSPKSPGQIDDEPITSQLTKVEELTDATTADLTMDDLEDALATASKAMRALTALDPDQYLPAGYPKTLDEVQVPSDGLTLAKHGEVDWGGRTLFWSTYRGENGRWEKKIEKMTGNSLVWARYIQTEEKSVGEDGRVTRSFTSSTWLEGRLIRYVVGTHIFDNEIEKRAAVNSTAYDIRWKDVGIGMQPVLVWENQHELTVEEDGSAEILNFISRIKEPDGKIAWGVFAGSRTIVNPDATGSEETILTRIGIFTPDPGNPRITSVISTEHTVYGDCSQKIVRTRTNPDDATGATDRVITLNYKTDGSGVGVIEILDKTGGSLVEKVADLAWEWTGYGTITFTAAYGGAVNEIYIRVPPVVRWR